MKTLFRFLALAAMLVMSPIAAAQNFSPEQRREIETIVRDYLIKNPDVLQEVLAEMEKRQTAANSERARQIIKDNHAKIFSSPRDVVLGNPNGDVTLVEFFDYNCGYCKRAMTDMLALMKDDPKLRIVLKEFPVLGDASEAAAKVAVATQLQDKSAKKYLDFHQKLLSSRGPVGKAQALAAAKEAGFDVARLEKDIANPEIEAILRETLRLAAPLGLEGTPSYVVGEEVVVGAVGLEPLREKINTARCGKPAC